MNLPSYVENRSLPVRQKWEAIANSVATKEGQEVGTLVANKWLLNQVHTQAVMARTKEAAQYEKIEFILDDSEQLISRTQDGEDYISFKLADVYKDKFGVALPESVLQKWADAINSGSTVLGDVDHEAYDSLINQGLSVESIKEKIKSKPSIAKAVKAVYEKGRLWVRAMIDKRYRNQIQKSKGVSMEAVIKRDSSNNIIDADLLGFTFGMKHTPVISGTGVAF